MFRLSILFSSFFFLNSAKAEDLVETFVYPVGMEGQLEGYRIDQFFGTTAAEGYCSAYPYNQTQANCLGTWRYGHDGIDINNTDGSDCGKPVYASAAGHVVHAASTSGWGNQVRIRHLTSDGYRYTLYGHLQDINVLDDQEVTQGQQIGTIGNGGVSTACHLHFGVLTEDISGAGYYYNNMPSTHLDPIEFVLGHFSSVPANIEAALDAREATAFSVLNPHSGNTDGSTPLSVLGTPDGTLDMWFGTDLDNIVYDDGVPNDAYVQQYTGGTHEGMIIVHPDSGMAVELYGTPYKVWAGESSSYAVTDNCGVSWFAGGYGPHSEFGLPLTGKYYVPENDRWRVDFQRGYMSWDTNTQTMYLNCYTYATPGWTTFTDMGWDDAISAAVARAYERNGAKSIVGYAFDDNDGGTTLHIWDGEVIQNFANGEAGENAIIVNLDALSESLPLENTASVVRGGFWDYYGSNDGPAYFGSPLGDEMDTATVNGELTGYDPVCDDNDDGENDLIERESCIIQYCGTDSDYSSMQRFEEVTLCYDYWNVYVACDPNSDNWVCSYVGSSSVNHEGDLWVYGSTIYWVDGGETHGIVSSEMFEACGFDWAEPYPVTEDVFGSLPEGDTLHDPVACGAVVDGTLVDQSGTVYEYWASDASWHGYPSTLVFDACLNDWNLVETMTSSVFSTITTGSVIGNSVDCGVLNPGDLVHWNGTIYRITENSLKRGFTSSDVFNACAYDWDLVTYLANEEYPIVTTLQDGSAISSTSDCSNVEGDLVHWEWTSTVYYLTGTGYKRGVTSPEAMTACGFDWNSIRYVTNANGAVVWTLGDAANITGNGDCP